MTFRRIRVRFIITLYEFLCKSTAFFWHHTYFSPNFVIIIPNRSKESEEEQVKAMKHQEVSKPLSGCSTSIIKKECPPTQEFVSGAEDDFGRFYACLSTSRARAKIDFIYIFYIILCKLIYISLLMGVDGAFYLHFATLCYTVLALFWRFSMRKCIWSEQNV